MTTQSDAFAAAIAGVLDLDAGDQLALSAALATPLATLGVNPSDAEAISQLVATMKRRMLFGPVSELPAGDTVTLTSAETSVITITGASTTIASFGSTPVTSDGGSAVRLVTFENAQTVTALGGSLAFAAGEAVMVIGTDDGWAPAFRGVDSLLGAKVATTRSIAGGGLVTGGGDLSANRTLTVTEASEAEALAGTVGDTAMTPRRSKAVVDAAVATLEAAIDDLAAGQGAGTVNAESWTVLASYDAGDRVEGDYGKVTGADAGTHTDPVVGGTKANRGNYRWSDSPAGWKWVGALESDDAAASAIAAAAAAAAGDGPLRHAELLAHIGTDASEVVSATYGDTNQTAALFPGGGSLFSLHPTPFAQDGIIQDISIDVGTTGGTSRFFIRRAADNRIIWASGDMTAAAGPNTFVRGVQLPKNLSVKKGDTLLHFATGANTVGQLKIGAAASDTNFYGGTGASLALGVVATASNAYNRAYAFAYTLVSRLPQDEDTKPVRPARVAQSERFVGTSLPAGWTNSNGSIFSVDDGVLASGSGSTTTVFYSNTYSALSQRTGATLLTPTDGAVVAFGARPDPASDNFQGGMLKVDWSANKLGIYTYYANGTMTLRSEGAISAYVSGREYAVFWTVEDQAIYGNILDTSDADNVPVSVKFDGAPDAGVTGVNYPGYFKGGLCFMHISGTVKWSYAQHLINAPRNIKTLIITDSNGAGNVTTNYGKNWPTLLAEMRQKKDIVVSAEGGDAGQFLNRLAMDLNGFDNIENVLIALTSNFAVHATWRTTIRSIIDAVEARGFGITLASATPVSVGDNTVRNLQNADILGGYFGHYPVLDLAKIVTTDGDRINWITAFDAGDHVHLAPLGHFAIRDEIEANPAYWYLFKDSLYDVGVN